MPGFTDGGNINTTTCFSHIYPSDHQPLQEYPVDVRFIHQSSNFLEHSSSTKADLSDNEPSAVVDKLECGKWVTQKMTPMGKKRKNRETSSLNSAQSKGEREGKRKKQRKCNIGAPSDAEDKKHKSDQDDQNKVPNQEAQTDYIHVRARRGQATDSHSLAERVRREKISERMKLLQALVPGCDKVNGKALMLDEIINYVQSLQNQVEFLSMKLASANPTLYDFRMDLDPFMVRPETLSSLASPLPYVQQCSLSQPNFTTSTNNYALLETSASVFHQQGQRQNNALSQDNGSLLWEGDDQRRRFTNQFSGITDNFCSFQ